MHSSIVRRLSKRADVIFLNCSDLRATPEFFRPMLRDVETNLSWKSSWRCRAGCALSSGGALSTCVWAAISFGKDIKEDSKCIAAVTVSYAVLLFVGFGWMVSLMLL
ncbi:hypothetical protein BST61_g11515 [Cercospora zeina]